MRLTTERFIKKAREVHGDKYDYSKVEYKYNNIKVVIICPKHGEFMQIPSGHTRGKGCPLCAVENQRNTTEQFIEKARQVHGDKYDYSKTEYKKHNKQKVIIICRRHGIFRQAPVDHIKGGGCPSCSIENTKLGRSGFVEKARKVHGDKYDYSKVEYKNSRAKVIIICPRHGEFEQNVYYHLNGRGCPTCASNKLSIEQFIEKAREVHGDKYDYSKVEYKNSRAKIIIICPRHGEFEQKPNKHLMGKGCQVCAIENATSTTDEFIEKAREVHGDKYDYSKVEYKNCATKVAIICPEHGEFEQRPNSHLCGQGCLKCSKHSRSTTDEFIEKAREVHGDKYDYSKVEYRYSDVDVIIACPKHGEFEQKPHNHLFGFGCKACATENITSNIQEFIEKSCEIHGDKYDYSKVDYINSYTKAIIVCPEHGEFKQKPSAHLKGHGCPMCPTVVSSGHQEIIDHVTFAYSGEVVINDRQTIAPYELDIYIPEHKFAIEFHGNYWHSYDHTETTEERRRHQHKADQCLEKGIELYQIFEYEWINNIKRNIWKSMISHKLGQSNRIYARKCEIGELRNQDINEFFNESHLQGHRDAKKCYGLYYQDILMASMTFSPSRNKSWEIIRYACKPFHTVVGGAQKLFKRFLKDVNPKNIITYADRRHSVGNLYRKMGFKEMKATSPNYAYWDGNDVYSRQKFQKHKLKKKLDKFDPELTEAENMFANGYRRIWDAGHYKFIAIKHKYEENEHGGLT